MVGQQCRECDLPEDNVSFRITNKIINTIINECMYVDVRQHERVQYHDIARHVSFTTLQSPKDEVDPRSLKTPAN